MEHFALFLKHFQC